MQVQVVLGEIGEHRHVIVDARHAPELQRVGRDLHHRMGTALVRHLFKKLMQLQALGGGVLGVQEAVADHVAVCADEAHLGAELRFQHMLEDIGGACLAAGAGEAHHLHAGGRIAVKLPACDGQPITAVAHLNVGCAVRRCVLAQYRRRAVLHGLRDEAVPVGLKALDGDKEVAWLRFAGIVADAADLQLRIGGAFQYVDMLEKLRKLHGVSLRNC